MSSKNLYSTNGKEYLEANRELAENLQLPDEDAAQITIPKADPAAQATDRKKRFSMFWASSCRRSVTCC